MITIVTIEGQKHIYNIYGCLVGDNNTVILRVSVHISHNRVF